MELTSAVGTILLILNGLITYKGFKDPEYFRQYRFSIDEILIGKEYIRLISSGFLHVNWIHFGFNMLALMAFSLSLENVLGITNYLIIYFLSLVGGNLLALYIHRNHGDYSAAGASGAISGIMMAAIVMFPTAEISFILIPISFKNWVVAILFVLISILGIKSQNDNIGHEAHLGGAIIGVLSTLLIQPSIIVQNWWIVLLVLIPTTAFLILIIRSPNMLMISNYWGDDLQQAKSFFNKKEEGPSLDYLLDKINKSGMESLTKKEREQLKKLSNKL